MYKTLKEYVESGNATETAEKIYEAQKALDEGKITTAEEYLKIMNEETHEQE